MSPHLAEQRHGLLPLLGFFARAHPRVVADDVGLHSYISHLAEQRQSPLPLLAFLARADPSVVAELGLTRGQMTLGSSFTSRNSPSSAKARCHWTHFSHALIPALQLMTSRSSFAFHISLSSVKAHCHCTPFSHALIPALQLTGADAWTTVHRAQASWHDFTPSGPLSFPYAAPPAL
ncbi:unnamed protein product [Prorocentrum cordatum]|uniref:Uncharacterized protein n=1 Tax=Prorocentrum cordatum TaxID=2364126 RepID=A0ABN9VLZ1_9DINO|nr:unnamed protein product [Polarella glacialis]